MPPAAVPLTGGLYCGYTAFNSNQADAKLAFVWVAAGPATLRSPASTALVGIPFD
ncbi:MAG TPA: hypothetical protein VEZ50_18415 [Nodosilinea sp.]|nr:hypothetical protein [Nodosilinea sp.]